jgi:hypothetical protein
MFIHLLAIQKTQSTAPPFPRAQAKRRQIE